VGQKDVVLTLGCGCHGPPEAIPGGRTFSWRGGMSAI